MRYRTKIAGATLGCLTLAGGGAAFALSPPTTHQAAPAAHQAPVPAARVQPAPVDPVTPTTTPTAAPAPSASPTQAPVTPTTVAAPAPVTTATDAPQSAPSAPVAPVAPDPAQTPTAAPAGAPDGPQPVGPSVTVEQTTCLATWYITTTDPTTGQTSQVEDFYGGDCTEANTLAAEYGGTVTQSTNPVTTTPGELPGT